MASVRCPSVLASDSTVQFINDYSLPKANAIYEDGFRSTEVEPFCGKESNKQPFNIFKTTSSTDAREYNLNTFQWVINGFKNYHMNVVYTNQSKCNFICNMLYTCIYSNTMYTCVM